MSDRDEGTGPGSARASPRIPGADGDGPLLKRPKIEPADTDSEDLRQVRQQSRVYNCNQPQLIINLED